MNQHAKYELPLPGATGYASVPLDLRQQSDAQAVILKWLSPGTGYVIDEERGAWFYVTGEDFSGWVQSALSFVNLPDIIPSIIYDNTNNYASRFLSSGKEIPGITGQALYHSQTFNPRLGREEYIMPVLYPMAVRIYKAQQCALAAGESLKMYEGYRPYAVQQTIVRALSDLADKDPQVMAGITTPPWEMEWFIATSVSNHQLGYAMDVTLVKIDTSEQVDIEGYATVRITAHTEYEMPTKIDELSMASATFTGPVPTRSAEWDKATLNASMNDNAVRLQQYCTGAGLYPLASEWWHFNDIHAMQAAGENTGVGDFTLDKIYSVPPPKSK